MSRRVSKTLIAVAISLILIAYYPGPVKISHGPVEPGNFRGKFFASISDIYFEIESLDHRNLSVYLLTYDDGYRMLEDESLENVTIIVAIENTNSYEGVLCIPQKDWYAIVVVTPINETVEYMMRFSRITPYLDLLIVGVTFLVLVTYLERQLIINYISK